MNDMHNSTLVRGSTLLIKAAIIGLGAVVAAICVLLFPAAIGNRDVDEYRPIIVALLLSSLPFFFALYQTIKLLTYVDKNKVFSQLSVNSLKYIKYAALVISVWFAAWSPLVFTVADKDDAPGVLLVDLIVVFAAFVIAAFAAMLQKLLQTAIHIKSENDLTV